MDSSDAASLAQAGDRAWQSERNLLPMIERELDTTDPVIQIDRITLYVATTSDFTGQHLVAGAATGALYQALGGRGGHAGTALGVVALPASSPTEVDAIVRVRPVRIQL